MKKFIYSVAAATLFSVFCHTSFADLIVRITENNSGVAVTSSGTVEIPPGTDPLLRTPPLPASLSPRARSQSGTIPAAVGTGPEGSALRFNIPFAPSEVTGPSEFGTRIFPTAATNGSGDWHGFSLPGSNAAAAISVNPGYVSGDRLESESTFDGQTFVSIGLEEGIYNWQYGSNQIVLVIGDFAIGDVVHLGDVDENGLVDFLDIDDFINVLSSGNYALEADINEDGVVDFLDISPFIAVLSGN